MGPFGFGLHAFLYYITLAYGGEGVECDDLNKNGYHRLVDLNACHQGVALLERVSSCWRMCVTEDRL